MRRCLIRLSTALLFVLAAQSERTSAIWFCSEALQSCETPPYNCQWTALSDNPPYIHYRCDCGNSVHYGTCLQ
jgi:hypothetical protein